MSTDNPYCNRLANETSPYLLQHAHNPVEWHPWGKEALALAREQDKPILLSIGYSACHWCHVMAHESFEDPATAEIMNKFFINIKVDREERPDLDKIYQHAHQLLNQRGGGWPLTAIIVPGDHTPFFVGTYFPKQAAHGMPSFTEVLQRVSDFYQQHRDEIEQQNMSMRDALNTTLSHDIVASEKLNEQPLDNSVQQLASNFDRNFGGFGSAPKFPHPTNLERLLRHHAKHADEGSKNMLRFTLHAMASGGIYDQLGGGFCRYSVDERWMIPHFEKMLYDNGPLLALYADAFAAFADPVFKRITTETAQWVMREMQSADGGYYSTLDADSEDEEGLFYVWTPQQVKALLDKNEYDIVSRIYGLDQPANFEGHWHLHVYANIQDIAKQIGISHAEVQQQLNSARNKLFNEREKRIHPGRDEKILTAWNGLMIKGMAIAGRRLGDNVIISSAHKAVDFIKQHLFKDGRLLASYKDGQAKHMAYLDDYAFLIDGLIELLQSQWRNSDLEFAIELAECLLEYYEDKPQGGFYFTANDHEQLVQRPKSTQDEAIPAGNAIAASVLGKLGHLLGELRYITAAKKTLQWAWMQTSQAPYAHCAMLNALEDYLTPQKIIVIRASEDSLIHWQQTCQAGFKPQQLCFAIPEDVNNLPGLLNEKKATDNPVAYICEGLQCHPAITTMDELQTSLA